MNITCNGVITGYTAALRQQSGEQDRPIILQLWRKKFSQPDTYHKMNSQIAIDEILCMDGLTEVLGEVFHCNLDRNNIMLVSVQPGDILGLQSSERHADDIMLGFAKVSSGPTNYMVDEGFFSPAATSSTASMISSELPQIALEIESSGKIKY